MALDQRLENIQIEELYSMRSLQNLIRISIAAEPAVRELCGYLAIQLPIATDNRQQTNENIRRFYKETPKITLERLLQNPIFNLTEEVKQTLQYISSLRELYSGAEKAERVALNSSFEPISYLRDIKDANVDVIEEYIKVLESSSKLKSRDEVVAENLKTCFALVASLNKSKTFSMKDLIEDYEAKLEEDYIKAEQTAKQKEIIEKKKEYQRNVDAVNNEYLDIKEIFSTSFTFTNEDIVKFALDLSSMIKRLEEKYSFPLPYEIEKSTLDNIEKEILDVHKYILSETNRLAGFANYGRQDIKDILREEHSYLVRNQIDALNEKLEMYERLYGAVSKMENCNEEEAREILKAYSMMQLLYDDIEEIKLQSNIPEIADLFSK